MNNKGLYDADWINLYGNNVHKTAVIHPNVSMGTGNTIGAYCVLGGNGEMRNVDQNDFKGEVVIGDNNVISEFVSIQRPFKKDEVTKIGSNNIIMAHSHIGHNAIVNDNCEICTGSIIGGYCVIHDDVKIKLGVTVRNRIHIGKGSIIGFQSAVAEDIPEGVIALGVPARVQCRVDSLE